MDYIALSEFNDENISQLFPKLSMISVGNNVTDSVNVLRNKLLNSHSNNIVSLKYTETHTEIDIALFPQLKEIHVTNPNINALQNIVQHAHDLVTFSIEFDQDHSEYDDSKMKELIITLFNTCCKLNRFNFQGTFCHIQKIIKLIVMVLMDTNNINDQEMTFVFGSIDNNIEIDYININISKITNALDASNINNFMIGIHISDENDKTLEETLKVFENKYLATFGETQYSIIISNNNCKINGYSATWLNKAI
eukprot:442143_1